MPNDYVTLKALTAELSDTLRGGRIDRVNLPAEREVALFLRAGHRNYTLLLSATGTTPHLRLTEEKLPNLPVAPTFCMVLRKHLTGGSVESVRLLNGDRIAAIEVRGKNELNDPVSLRLILEILGGGSNIVLTDGEGIVIDCMRRTFGETGRTAIPHRPYTYPQKRGIDLSDGAAVAEAASRPDFDLDAFVAGQLNGLAKESAAELIDLAKRQSLPEAARTFADLGQSALYQPCLLETQNGPAGFFAYPYRTMTEQGARFTPCRSLCEATEIFYAGRHAEAVRKQKVKPLLTELKRQQKRLARRLEENAIKRRECEKKDEILQQAEILKCNIHRMERGKSIIDCFDFYNNREIRLAVSPELSPKKNIEKYFKRYAKAKGAERYAIAEREELATLSAYLASIAEAIENSATDAEFDEIGKELAALSSRGKNAVAPPSPKVRKEKKSPPLRLEADGYTVYLGRNNQQNEVVTFELASGGDVWLHAKDYHGAHAVIVTNGSMPSDRTIADVAALVAHFSGARHNSKAEVDYTFKKFVKRLDRPGLVRYTNQKTLLVVPSDSLLKAL